MRNILYIILIAVSFSFISCEKEDGELSSENFLKFYGSSYSDVGNKVIAYPGGYFIAGLTTNSSGFSDMYISNIDEAGNLKWEKKQGFSNSDEEAVDLIVSSGNEVVVIGNSERTNGTTSLILAKYNLNGDSILVKEFYNNSDEVRASVVIDYPGVGYAIGATTKAATSSSGQGISDFLLFALSSNGDSLFSQTTGSSQNDVCYDLIFEDNIFVMVGSTERSIKTEQQKLNIAIEQFNQFGVPFASWTYGGVGDDIPHSVTITSDGNYLVVGESVDYLNGTGINCYAILINGSNISKSIFEKELIGNLDESWFSAVASQTGEFYIAGYTESLGNGGRDGYLCKMDNNGNIMNETTFGYTGEEEFKSIIIDNENLILTGFAEFEKNSMIFIAKTDLNGKIK